MPSNERFLADIQEHFEDSDDVVMCVDLIMMCLYGGITVQGDVLKKIKRRFPEVHAFMVGYLGDIDFSKLDMQIGVGTDGKRIAANEENKRFVGDTKVDKDGRVWTWIGNQWSLLEDASSTSTV